MLICDNRVPSRLKECSKQVNVYKIIHNFGQESFVVRCLVCKPLSISNYSTVFEISELEYLTHQVLNS